jgi:hypothetical protein
VRHFSVQPNCRERAGQAGKRTGRATVARSRLFGRAPRRSPAAARAARLRPAGSRPHESHVAPHEDCGRPRLRRLLMSANTAASRLFSCSLVCVRTRGGFVALCCKRPGLSSFGVVAPECMGCRRSQVRVLSPRFTLWYETPSPGRSSPGPWHFTCPLSRRGGCPSDVANGRLATATRPAGRGWFPHQVGSKTAPCPSRAR